MAPRGKLSKMVYSLKCQKKNHTAFKQKKENFANSVKLREKVAKDKRRRVIVPYSVADTVLLVGEGNFDFKHDF